jgi:surface protein
MPSLAFAGEVDVASEAEDFEAALSSNSSSVYWYRSGTCEWSVSDGNLVVRPANGASEGALGSANPWGRNNLSLKTARFEGTIHASDAAQMFYGCKSLESVDLSGLDTSDATSMADMFYFCSSLVSISGLTSLNTSCVTDMSGMFEYCGSLESLDLSAFDTSNVTDMSSMFLSCSLTSLDLTNFDTSKVTDMTMMFRWCDDLKTLDIEKFDTSSVTSVIGMFSECSSLEELDVSSFDTSNVKNMGAMFYGCSSLKTLDVSNFDTSNVETMGDLLGPGPYIGMFCGCSSLTSLDLSNFDTSKVTIMEKLFSGCKSLTSLDLSSFDTSSVTEMRDMFYGCSALGSLDLSQFDTSKATDMHGMFYGCSSLESLDLSNFSTSSVSSSNVPSYSYMDDMFSGCDSLRSVALGEKFSFCGSGTERLCSLPTPSGDGLTGKWVSSADGVAYAADAIPNNVAATYTAETQGASGQTVFRMYNPITSEHLFTTDESEYESLITENWQKEGEAWSSPTSGKGVYRLYNAGLGALAKMSHHYTTDEAEVKLLTEQYGWVADNGGNPIFYSAEDESGNALEGASPVYRLYNGGLSAHHYTLDKDENDQLTTNHGWSGEGVGFYAVKTNSAGVE